MNSQVRNNNKNYNIGLEKSISLVCKGKAVPLQAWTAPEGS